MKTYYILLITFFWALGLEAQSIIEKSFNASGVSELNGDFTWADVEITGWEGNRIEVVAQVSINDGENDDAFQLEAEQSGNTLSIVTDIKGMDQLPKIITVMHEGKKYFFKKEGDYKEQIEQLRKDLGVDELRSYSTGVAQEIKLTIKVPAKVALRLESTYGAVKLTNCSNIMDIQNTYGPIEVVFSKNTGMKDARLSSTYSFVDVSIPASAKVDVELNTSYGSLFTDLDIDVDKSASEEKAFFNKVVGRINGGGPELKMQAKYNNVYLRKI